MTRVEYYTKNRKVYHYTPTQAEQKEIDAQRRRQFKGRLYAEKLAQEQYEYEHRAGYCTKCFLLKPITGVCPTCD